MIPFNFEYYKPDTIEEAVKLFLQLEKENKKPRYYGGGTEIISMARAYNIHTEAVIDIKGIPECNVQELRGNKLIIGAAVTLTQITELNLFPYLGLAVQRIADHTIQHKITLGGNIAGTIIYKEATLPLLTCNAEVVIAGAEGNRQLLLRDILEEKNKLCNGEFIVAVIIDSHFLNLPYAHAKRTKSDKIDYPLVTISAIKDNDKINIAFSGLYNSPFRSPLVEEYLNNPLMDNNEKINNIIEALPSPLLNDLSGSAEFRKFMLQTMLIEVFDRLGGE